MALHGMTEAAYVTWQKAPGSIPLGKSGTILPNMQASLRLENGDDASEGGPRELWLKGLNMVAGYVDNPEANQKAFDQEGCITLATSALSLRKGICKLWVERKRWLSKMAFRFVCALQ